MGTAPLPSGSQGAAEAAIEGALLDPRINEVTEGWWRDGMERISGAADGADRLDAAGEAFRRMMEGRERAENASDGLAIVEHLDTWFKFNRDLAEQLEGPGADGYRQSAGNIWSHLSDATDNAIKTLRHIEDLSPKPPKPPALPPAKPITPPNRIQQRFRGQTEKKDPLVFDLNFDGVRLTKLGESGVSFNFDGGSTSEGTGWISPKDGLLVLDKNSNGTIDDGGELFGSDQEDGFTALRAYDTNSDGLITSADAIYSNARMWIDSNSDGISQSSELYTLASLQIAKIDLNAQQSSGSREGNSILYTGSYELQNGARHEVAAVGFATDRTNTTYTLPSNFEYDEDVFELPNLKGYGDVPDLWVAMTLDPVLKAMVQD